MSKRWFKPDEVNSLKNGTRLITTLPSTCAHCRLMGVIRTEASCVCKVTYNTVTEYVLGLTLPDPCPLRNGSLVRIPDADFPFSHIPKISNVERATFDKGS